MKESAVYIFTGFMDSGKTTLIRSTLMDGDFSEGGKSLLIVCEDGDEEYDEAALEKKNVTIVRVEKEEEFTAANLKLMNDTVQPDMVFIEYNGTWKAATLLDTEMPNGWFVVQSLATVDASTYDLYLKNMRTMMTEQIFSSDVVIFNRCNESTEKARFRRTVKANNRKAQVVFELENGQIDESAMEELPYDLNQDVIEITDADYGIFYLDVQENAKKYEGKTIKFLALVYHPDKLRGRKYFVAGRFAMTCCVEDIQYIGLKCKYDQADFLEHKGFVNLTAEIHTEFAKEYRGRGPVLYAKSVEKAEKPEDPLVYFT